MQVFMILTDVTGKKKSRMRISFVWDNEDKDSGEEQPRVLFKLPDLCALHVK